MEGFGWSEGPVVAVGGLTEVGWCADGRHLLVLSSSGRGVLDTANGAWVARDRRTDFASWFDATRLRAHSIGAHSGEPVSVSGLAGGGLAAQSQDGWSIEVVHPDWPYADVILGRPGCAVLYEVAQAGKHVPGCRQIARVLELRAAGFSPTGETVVVADGGEVRIFRRGT